MNQKSALSLNQMDNIGSDQFFIELEALAKSILSSFKLQGYIPPNNNDYVSGYNQKVTNKYLI